MDAARAIEIAKYEKCYADPAYRMMGARQALLVNLLGDGRGLSYLDVSCGRGESLIVARSAGFDVIVGTEAVDALIDGPDKVKAVLPDLPFGDRSFDVVSCFDVMEHIPLEALGKLYLTTRDGQVLALEPGELPAEFVDEYYLYDEICPVHPLIASKLDPVVFA